MQVRKNMVHYNMSLFEDISFQRITAVGNVNVLDEYICFSSIRFPGMHYGLGIQRL